jgi:hypothetical protein
MIEIADKRDLRTGDVIDVQGLKTTVIGFEKTPLGQELVCTPFGNFDKDSVRRLNARVERGE